MVFGTLYDKPMNFIIVNSDLTYFRHIHPVLKGEGFEITTQFPKADIYHLYTEFQPNGGIEQQVGFTFPVQKPENISLSNAQPDGDKTKIFDNYSVSVNTRGSLQATAMSLGQQTISFTLTD